MKLSGPVRLLPPLPPALRFALGGAVVAALAYAIWAIEHPAAAPTPEAPAAQVPLPTLDDATLARARDDSREQRLVLEPEPLRHLLAKAIDVGPTVAQALGRPDRMTPVATVRAVPATFRKRWLWYEGQLEQLSGPQDGHPLPGYAIYEATLRLADGEAVLAAFSLPPEAGLAVGSWVRVEGFFLKLRDLTYPTAIDRAPLLIGRSLQRDFADWPAVTQLDPAVLAKVDDSSYWPGDLAWHTLEEDQTEALWHLAAYARDTAATRTLADWRRIGTLNTHEVHEKLIAGQIARGTPLRVIGTLIKKSVVAAPPNPAGIEAWTVGWVQVREYGGGVLVPVWAPKRVEWETRAQLEVRGFYYRWQAYETLRNERRRAPLFVAADLDLYDLVADRTMQTIGTWLLVTFSAFVALVFWSQRRDAARALAHSRDLDARRRRERQRAAAKAAAPPAPPPA
ncbi:MAG: hypothetical protein FJ301_06180 [Planctomycetes bacterium]|nr:hypothetical protein [Planctomycetota bacterium]